MPPGTSTSKAQTSEEDKVVVATVSDPVADDVDTNADASANHQNSKGGIGNDANVIEATVVEFVEVDAYVVETAHVAANVAVDKRSDFATSPQGKPLELTSCSKDGGGHQSGREECIFTDHTKRRLRWECTEDRRGITRLNMETYTCWSAFCTANFMGNQIVGFPS